MLHKMHTYRELATKQKYFPHVTPMIILTSQYARKSKRKKRNETKTKALMGFGSSVSFGNDFKDKTF